MAPRKSLLLSKSKRKHDNIIQNHDSTKSDNNNDNSVHESVENGVHSNSSQRGRSLQKSSSLLIPTKMTATTSTTTTTTTTIATIFLIVSVFITFSFQVSIFLGYHPSSFLFVFYNDEISLMPTTTTTTTTNSSLPLSLFSFSKNHPYPNNINNYLAYSQSFGFFDDISNQHWKEAQDIHSKLFPNHYYRDHLYRHSSGTDNKDPKFRIKVAESSYWYGNAFHEEFHCPLARRLPSDGMADGPKWVCDPHRLKKQKQNNNNNNNNNDCLVYSFGSNGKAEFEKAVIEEIGPHCEIHTFDPKKQNRRNGDFATALSGYSTFHPWGLGTPLEEEQTYRQQQQQQQRQRRSPTILKTLQTTMEELGHVNRTIHIFKIDCEWCEWFTYTQWLQHDIRQILVETHNAPMPQAQDFFYTLHDAGYVIFHKEANYENGAGGMEYGFLKLEKEFFQDKLYYNYNSTNATMAVVE